MIPRHKYRVLHIASGDLFAGAEVQLYHLLRAMSGFPDMALTVILLNHGLLEDRLREAGIDVRVIDETRQNAWQILRAIQSIATDIRPDLLHTHRQKENVLGALVAMRRRIPLVKTMHGAPEFSLRPWQILKRTYRYLDYLSGRYASKRVVAVSEELGGLLARKFPGLPVSVIENGIDSDQLLRAANARVDLPGPPDRMRIAIVGRMVPVKRMDLFLQVARALADRTPGAYSFYVFGDGPLRDQVESERKRLGLESEVFMMGFVSNLPAFLSAMDLLLITSDHEGVPMNLLEAMALSVPVVASAVGGVPVVLEGGACGALVQGQNVQEYVIKSAAILADREYAEALAAKARTRIRDNYEASIVAGRYAQLYRELARGSGRQSRV